MDIHSFGRTPKEADRLYRKQVERAWLSLVERGGEVDPKLRDVVRDSWLRCLAMGVEPVAQRPTLRGTADALEQLRDRNVELLRAFQHTWRVLGDILADTQSCLVIADASGTLLDEVNHLLARAVEQRSRWVRLADRAARLYAPVVHVTALATFVGWLLAGLAWQPALVIAITVLIITCPCALGLAVPAVQVVCASAMFKRGVLLNSGEALERLAGVDAIIFDKTGTLTLPKAEIANLAQIDPRDLAHAGALAAASNHPLARVIALASGARAPSDAREAPGQGVEARLDGDRMRLGSASFCDASDDQRAGAAQWPDASLIYFRHGERVVSFAIRQALRPDAREIVAGLAARGFAIEILSGDRVEAVAAVARELSVATYAAGLKPADKIARLEQLKAKGHRVLMVGDGLNDAPALAAAHVSLSPISASHLAQAHADAVFLGERLAPVAAALVLAGKARRLMLQNLWLSVAYNAIAVPIAISGHATPLVAALAMSGSSILVTLNALRARHARGFAP